LIQLLERRKEEWYRERGEQIPGIAGDILGNCISTAATGPEYRAITVRDALNLMALRTLRVRRGEIKPNDAIYGSFKPLSWKFQFRKDPNAETRLGGVPVFQTF
jgi:hypothetical protein